MSRKPNILLLLTDDQRFDMIGSIGNRQVITPCMDWLVSRGTAFTHAHIMGGSNGAVCMPSRAMIHTGRTLYRIEGEGQRIADDHALLGETFRRAGYETYGIGKWHNSPEAYARSFTGGAQIMFGGMSDHWNVPTCRFDPTGVYDKRRTVCRDPMHSNALTHDLCDQISPGKHSSELFCDAAVDYLRRRESSSPFFLYLAFTAPHDPRTMPPEYLAMYEPKTIALPPNFMPVHPFDNGEMTVRDEHLARSPRGEDEIRRHLAEYYAMITHADAQMQRVIDALRERGELDNTLIVLAGDNGLALGQHGLMGKQSLYDHSVRVPLVMAGPGIPQGQRSAALVYLLDIFPTLCELSGIDTPTTVEGKSLCKALSDPSTSPREYLHLAYRHLHRGVRDHRHKLIEYHVDGRRHTQLFDLQSDPAELSDLSTSPSSYETLTRLRRELRRWQTDLADTREQGSRFWSGVEAG